MDWLWGVHSVLPALGPAPRALDGAPDDRRLRAARTRERSDVIRRVPRLFVAASVVAAAATALILTTTTEAAPVAQAAEVPHAAGFTAPQMWNVQLNDPNNPIALSSPNVATLGDGQPAVVVGDRAGWVYAYHLSGGTQVPGWPYYAGEPVDSSPSVAPINANGQDTVYVGDGNAADPCVGWLPGHHSERGRPVVRPGDQPGDRPHGPFRGVGVAHRRQLRRQLRGRGRIARAEHLRPGRQQRGHARRLPVVLRRLGLLDGGGGRPLQRQQQRDHQRRGLQRGFRLRRVVRQRGPHPHHDERGQLRARGTRAAASSASTTRRRTSTARRPPSDSSSPAAASASRSATAATTRAPPTRTRSSPSTRPAAWPGATPSTGSPPTRPPSPTSRATDSSTWWKGPRPTPSTC